MNAQALVNQWISPTGNITDAAKAFFPEVGAQLTLAQQSASARAAAALALKAQQDANALAEANARPPGDNEGARAASDNERRKLLAGSMYGIGMPTRLGAPPIGFRELSGS